MVPLIHAASREAGNTTAGAMSSGVACRPISARTDSTVSTPMDFSKSTRIGVSTRPGSTALIRGPWARAVEALDIV